jgi:hypothetical protein
VRHSAVEHKHARHIAPTTAGGGHRCRCSGGARSGRSCVWRTARRAACPAGPPIGAAAGPMGGPANAEHTFGAHPSNFAARAVAACSPAQSPRSLCVPAEGNARVCCKVAEEGGRAVSFYNGVTRAWHRLSASGVAAVSVLAAPCWHPSWHLVFRVQGHQGWSPVPLHAEHVPRKKYTGPYLCRCPRSKLAACGLSGSDFTGAHCTAGNFTPG